MNASPATNPFEALAAQQQSAASKRKDKAAERRAAKSVVLSERDAPMKGTPMEEARDERNALMAGYRRHKAKERDDLLSGPLGTEVAALVALLRGITIDGAGALVAAVMRAGWLMTADTGTRHRVLSLIDDAIIRLRVRNGLPPFDDAIFDEPPNAFQIIRKEMMGV